ncbi:hypothetical protein JG677_00390 [Campylobacter sp. TTU-622]|uniref:flagellar FLiS export co-chaperone n=1 Tax=unclassified Campylobacter TaxID=2593542 RepID=UPI001908CF44|nr:MULTISPECIES: flagellar FLiS export co-chaperone [unclassified Campylobacter]MBK1971359.1 hypothetical protein [Campylobacter sp. TTU_617]MBK1972532.1 hypothetical protein [Campylobacter sp. TTU-622]MBK1991034.1 hypothetical protein [Campylobacter sp. 2018MI34]
MDGLNTLKKHLGEVKEMSRFEAKRICSQINDANDFIGALQVLDLTLKKVSQNINQRLELNHLDDIQKRTLDANVASLIQNCSFMSVTLFGNIFNVYAGEQLFEFEITNPLLMLENNGYEGILSYIEDKRDEIKTILAQLASIIATGSIGNNTIYNTQTTDFKNLFR